MVDPYTLVGSFDMLGPFKPVCPSDMVGHLN